MSLVRHSAYNLVGGVIPVITALVTVPLYVHLIGPARYGVLAIAWILLGYFGLFDLGLGRATSFRIAAQVNATARERAGTFWTAALVNLGMGVVGGALLWLAAGYFFAHQFKVSAALRPEMLAAVPLLALSVPVATLTGVLTGAMQGRQKFLGINVISVVSSTLFQIVPLLVAWLSGPNLVWVLTAALSARFVGMAALAYCCWVELVRGHPPRLERGELPLLLKYGGWVTAGSFISPLLTVVDRFAIGATVGAVGVATYTIPFQLSKQVAVLPSALNTAFFPRIAAAASDEERSALEQDAIYSVSSLVSLPILAGIFLSSIALKLWVGSTLGAQAAPIAKVFFVAFWLNALALVPFTNLQAGGRPDLVVKCQIGEVVPYLVVLYAGLKWFGLVGAAGAFLVRMLMDYGLLSWANQKRFPGILVLAMNLIILLAGAYLSSLWDIADWQWWACAIVLGSIMLAIAWMTLPSRVKQTIADRLGLFRSRVVS